MNCIFCKIVNDVIPADKVYEDENFLAFLDIAPVNPGHTLVIPKTHYQDLNEAPESVVKGLFGIVRKVAAAAQKGLGLAGFNLGVNNGVVAGQVVGHLHVHIMPRREGDGYELWHGKTYAAGESSDVAEKIRGAF